MKNSIGVMQGRLLPKYNQRYQAHPVNYWQKEFYLAKKIGLDSIEFILDYNDHEINPLLTNNGLNEINKLVLQTGVSVESICADYFMTNPLFLSDSLNLSKNQNILKRLVNNSSQIGVKNIVIPCVDSSSLDSKRKLESFVDAVNPLIEFCEEKQVNLSLETDLSPNSFVKLISKFNSNRITVNYDIGNSASIGFKVDEELDAYGDKISDVHIKDRLKGGGSVVLGEGNSDFELFFSLFKNFNYEGPFIMQAYRDDQGVEIFKKQLEWVSPFLIEAGYL
jgi:L-ribulose-5-phosphate 3-epimerase UlaE